MIRHLVRAAHAGTILLLVSSPVSGLTLARPFGDHMVLPMEMPVRVWGMATAGAKVSLSFGNQLKQSTTDPQGTWQVILGPLAASAESRTLRVTEGGEQLAIEDVLVGRVWLCSGQSNMDFPLAKAIGGADEVKAAGNFPAIRLCNLTAAPTAAGAYNTATFTRLNRRDHFTGTWQRASATSAERFSAIAWWTGSILHNRLGVPIGLVENAVGGSGTEAWLPREVLETRPDYQELLDDRWLDSEKIGAWARGRANQNLGGHREAHHPFQPGFLFESGLRDWAGFRFDGVLWYQGETNAEINDIAWNRRLITDLVSGWRNVLGEKNLPFFLIQLPRIGGNDPLRAHWPEYRKAQADAAKRLKNVTLIVTQDLGYDPPDVHPPDKRPIAKRLAEALLNASPLPSPAR